MKKFFAVFAVLVLSAVSVGAFAEGEKISNCSKIKESLVNLQHADSRTRVYLGRYYETVQNKFIVPLNLRLVENNISDSELVNTQGEFKETRQAFIDDYISYQQKLEELVSINCEEEAPRFKEVLSVTREKRQVVAQDISKLRGLMEKQVQLVNNLIGRLK